MQIYPKSKESGVQNMATDWWLFENADKPSFRHYKWTSSQTSFGYGQDWKWVEQETSLSVRELIRRPTGGGIVRHGQDWTYCLILPRKHTSFKIPPLDLYKAVHGCVGQALSKEGFKSKLQPCPEKKGKIIPGDCFLEPVGWDLMNDKATKKIAGAAIKRSRTGLLLQGTIEIDHNLNVNEQAFENNFIDYLSLVISEPVEHVKWPENFIHERDKICDQYSDLEWKKNRARL